MRSESSGACFKIVMIFFLAVGVRLSQAIAAITRCPVAFQEIPEVGFKVSVRIKESKRVEARIFFMNLI
jgi:hypothetical protein